MPVEMLVPLRWRNKNFMLNPNVNGYRPEFWSAPPAPKEKVVEPAGISAKITCSTYNGDSTSYALREVKPYSEIMHPEITAEENTKSIQPNVQHEIQIRVPSGIIYQEAGLAG